jgi:hypothetical protein
MSTRTAQCEECTTVFEINATGRAPKLCPSCKNGAAERASDAPTPRKKPKAHTNGGGALSDALNALRVDLEATQERAATLEEAIGHLEKLVA